MVEKVSVAKVGKNREKTAPLVLIVAGEVSGDILGGEVMRALRERCPGVRFAGVGGSNMQAAGLAQLGDMDEFPGMGLVEVVGAIPRILRLRDRLVDWARREQPALVLTIDNQEFSKQLAAKLAPLGLPCVQYVAPKVWAWRQGRVKKLQQIFRQVLCLFPFEVDFFTRHGLPATYVGHPVARRLAALAKVGKGRGQAIRVALLPGSRRNELVYHWALFLAVFRGLRREDANVTGVLALPDERALARCRALGWAEGLEVVLGEARFAALRGCRAALTKSGTNNLELALLGVPAVVVYRMQAVSWAILRRVVKVKAVSPVNLVAGGLAGKGDFRETDASDGPVYPEYLQDDATVARLTAALRGLLAESPVRRRQLVRLKIVERRLATARPPAEMVAEMLVKDYLRS